MMFDGATSHDDSIRPIDSAHKVSPRAVEVRLFLRAIMLYRCARSGVAAKRNAIAEEKWPRYSARHAQRRITEHDAISRGDMYSPLGAQCHAVRMITILLDRAALVKIFHDARASPHARDAQRAQESTNS